MHGIDVDGSGQTSLSRQLTEMLDSPASGVSLTFTIRFSESGGECQIRSTRNLLLRVVL